MKTRENLIIRKTDILRCLADVTFRTYMAFAKIIKSLWLRVSELGLPQSHIELHVAVWSTVWLVVWRYDDRYTNDVMEIILTSANRNSIKHIVTNRQMFTSHGLLKSSSEFSVQNHPPIKIENEISDTTILFCSSLSCSWFSFRTSWSKLPVSHLTPIREL